MKIIDCIQGTPEWLECRAGVITGTKLSGVLGGPKAQLTAIYELIGEEFAPLEPIFETYAMTRGKELEAIAKAKYIDITGQEVIEIGFAKSEKYIDEFGEWLGFSPDGLIKKDDKFKKAIEIKCPGSKNFVKYLLEDKIPDDYFEQVLTYFLVNEDLEELDFIVFHPDFYITKKKLHIINIKREDLQDDLEKLEAKLLAFRKQWLDKIKLLTA